MQARSFADVLHCIVIAINQHFGAATRRSTRLALTRVSTEHLPGMVNGRL